jgi:hypothetical protein
MFRAAQRQQTMSLDLADAARLRYTRLPQMALNVSTLDSRLATLDERVGALASSCAIARAMERFRADCAAARFHLRRDDSRPTLVAVLGGTGTGKSTLVNRLLGRDVTATSFKRTFTAGAVAVAGAADSIPANWLGLQGNLLQSTDLPARGRADSLAIVTLDDAFTQRVTLIDTPDLDGDQPAHHAQADRVFRWAQAVVFLVTPEKYQMTELRPYYRLATRYGVPALFVMNKVEEQAVIDDYASQLEDGAQVYAIPRDDAAFEPSQGIDALREQLTSIEPEMSDTGNRARVADLLDRLRDQILAPLREHRREADRITRDLRAMEAPAAGIDVNPLTRQLQRRLQQRSVLYLMGPGRMLDRVRQVPGLLMRLPRTTWDLLRHGGLSRGGESGDLPKDFDKRVPDFRAMLQDQFAVVQSRVDDAIRSSAIGQRWIEQDAGGFAQSKIPFDAAGAIADEELADLRAWLEKRWNATPRDTALLKKLLAVLPGGESLTKWSEAAPYLLAVVVAAHHAFFGPIDLMVIGGFSLATWLTEKLSNEVTSRTRLTNARIATRFAALAHQQLNRTCDWLTKQAPAAKVLDDIESRANQLQEMLV